MNIKIMLLNRQNQLYMEIEKLKYKIENQILNFQILLLMIDYYYYYYYDF